jgi:hypothetical protein
MYTMGAMIFVMSVARVTVIRLRETPKFLLGQDKDAELVQNLHDLATQYNRTCSITLEQLEACGTIETAHSRSSSRFSFGELWLHIRSLFVTKKIAITTVLIWLSWSMIGLAYPLFNVFLPYYLQSRGVEFGVTSTYETWRNYALVQVCGIFGPVLGGHMANWRPLGRRYTMVIGALLTSKLYTYQVVLQLFFLTTSSGILLRLFPGNFPGAEHRIQLRDLLHLGNLLRHAIRIHRRGTPVCASRYR